MLEETLKSTNESNISLIAYVVFEKIKVNLRLNLNKNFSKFCKT